MLNWWYLFFYSFVLVHQKYHLRKINNIFRSNLCNQTEQFQFFNINLSSEGMNKKKQKKYATCEGKKNFF